jgi:hypothetical protein
MIKLEFQLKEKKAASMRGSDKVSSWLSKMSLVRKKKSHQEEQSSDTKILKTDIVHQLEIGRVHQPTNKITR